MNTRPDRRRSRRLTRVSEAEGTSRRAFRLIKACGCLWAGLEETGGEALVDRPFLRLLRCGLVQRQARSGRRCDDGIRLDHTGGECENCGNVVHIRRARRVTIVAQIDRELPGLSEGERHRVLEERLRGQAAMEAVGFVRRWERARAERACRDGFARLPSSS